MSTLHITNGDSAAGTMRTFLTDPVVISADPLWGGPAPDVDDQKWYELRGSHLSDGSPADTARVRSELAQWDGELDAALHRGDDIVLWFEHDLFDQLLLLRLLTRIARVRLTGGGVHLICIDRFPNVEPFYGLGQLEASDLQTLLPAQQPLTGAQIDTARRAWAAFRASDPRGLIHLVANPSITAPLPFLHKALIRFLEDYPSITNGLSSSAQSVVTVMPGDGWGTAFGIFLASQLRESAPFMGDTGVYDIMQALAAGRAPLLELGPETPNFGFRGRSIRLTDAGRAVRDGRDDAIRLNGIDEWHGGVHLTGGTRSPWRWDAVRETLVSLEN